MADGGQFVTIKSSPGEPEGPRPNEERGVHNPRVIDLIGLDAICAKADAWAHLGTLYEPTARMREMAANGETYYS